MNNDKMKEAFNKYFNNPTLIDWTDWQAAWTAALSTHGQESEAQEAPPSALAIETAAKRQAAELCDLASFESRRRILATIPQDGITELERFGMKCMNKALSEAHILGRIGFTENELLALVSSLIGEREE